MNRHFFACEKKLNNFINSSCDAWSLEILGEKILSPLPRPNKQNQHEIYNSKSGENFPMIIVSMLSPVNNGKRI